MGKASKIEWTDHTFNPWWGCTRISPACAHCYADAWAKRVGHEIWGPNAPRRFFGDAHWLEPLRWNREAEKAGERKRVFCASMADVFEDRDDLDVHRARLWELIAETTWLDWLLLTKRPWAVRYMVPWGEEAWPANVWVGATVEDDVWAKHRIPMLMQIPSVVRFLSCEPLVGPIDLAHFFNQKTPCLPHPINMVIAGGESGGHARVMHPDWVRQLRDHCVAAGVAFHFKQWGEFGPVTQLSKPRATHVVLQGAEGPIPMERVGKKRAGRVLDGRTWDEFPKFPARLV